MNVEIGIETPIFLFWEYMYLFRNFGILSLQCSSGPCTLENLCPNLAIGKIIVRVMALNQTGRTGQYP
jgi:hypothetical protein